MENSPSCKANSSSDSQEIPRILRNLEVHNVIHKSSPTASTLSQNLPVHPPHSTS